MKNYPSNVVWPHEISCNEDKRVWSKWEVLEDPQDYIYKSGPHSELIFEIAGSIFLE